MWSSNRSPSHGEGGEFKASGPAKSQLQRDSETAARNLSSKKLRTQAEARAGIDFGRTVEVDTGMLRADVDVAKRGLEGARRVHRVRPRSREHPSHGAAA